MDGASCCGKDMRVKKGAWSSEEDELLVRYVKLHGEGKWRSLAQKAGLNRSGKSCRLRWLNYLRPGIKRGHFSTDEDELILKLHRLLGNRWALIAGRLPGRTDNEVKNYWNTILMKKVQGQTSSDSGLTIRKLQSEDRKAGQDFSWKELKQIPVQVVKQSNNCMTDNDDQSSTHSVQIDYHQDNNCLISSTDVFNPYQNLISNTFNFDSLHGNDDKASDHLENGKKTDPLQHMELKKIASLLDIENELRELL